MTGDRRAPDIKKKGRIGSLFDGFLKQEGMYEEVTTRAINRVIACHLAALIEQDRGCRWPSPQNR
jgi:antitoxin HicB